MASLLPAGVVGLFIGFLLGVFCMALVAVSSRERLPEPRPVRTHAVRTSWPAVPEPSWAGTGGSHGTRTVRRITESTLEVAGTRARDHA